MYKLFFFSLIITSSYSCRNYKSIYSNEKQKTNDIESSSTDSNWINFVDCKNNDDSLKIIENIDCCLLDLASNGSESHEKIIIKAIESYDLKNSSNWIFCQDNASKSIVSKKILEAMLNFISATPELFICKEDSHKDLYCPAFFIVGSISNDVKFLSTNEYNLSELFIKIYNGYNNSNTCQCNENKASFEALKYGYDNGLIQVRDYLNDEY